MTRRIRKVIAALLACALMLSGWPSVSGVSAATDYVDVVVPGGGKIVNRSDMTSWNTSFSDFSANSFPMFKGKAEGTSVTTTRSYSSTGVVFELFKNNEFSAKINVSQNPTLKRLAQGGTARLLFNSGKFIGDAWTEVKVFVNGSEKYGGIAENGKSVTSGWIPFGQNDTIEINLNSLILSGEFNDLQLYFADIDVPTYAGNTFTTDGTVRYNDDPAVMKNELFLKAGTSANLALNFSEPVFPSTAEDASDRIDGKYNFLRTELFNNPGGDGFDPSIYYLSSVDAGYSSFASGALTLLDNSRTSFNLKYTAAANDSSGNAPLDPTRLTKASDEDRPTLLQRINDAGFVDGAGNPLATLTGIGVVPFADNANPAGTYRTIIDARPPQYSAVKNGVQPDILTGLVLNRGKQIRFDVNLNEKVLAANSSTENTRLAFANGMTAEYESGSNTATWTFVATVPDGKDVETATLNTTALEHPDAPGDGKALWDYAHNYLTETVKSIAWADLSIDNTAPDIGFGFKNEKGVEVPAGQYVSGGSFVLQASDPDLNGQASKGLFRPGSGSGLVYYWISRSPDDPFAGKEDDRFAAIKRYSLALKQPSEDLYPSGYEDVVLGVAENGATIPLPPEAEGGSGSWYLHTWAADMTWDSARQLKQYEKGSAQRAEYLAQNPDATPMEIETNFRQNILPGLAEYDNLEQWPLSDFMEDDSNWAYSVGELKLDNDKPSVSGGDIADNKTDNVRATITASDPTSSIKDGKVQYQFVKPGEQPDSGAWQDAALNEQGKATVSTLNDPAIDKGGMYELYGKAIDEAGNETVAKLLEVDVLVIFTQFETYPGTYAINDGPDFTIAGVPIDTIEYQYSASSERPDAATGWKTFEKPAAEATLSGEAGAKYEISPDQTWNGTVYVHIKVKQQDMNRYYYYFKEYKFDHLPPTVTFSSQGYLYPMPEQSTMIAVEDSLVDFAGVAAKNVLYQWVKVTEGVEETAPDKDSSGWKQAPSSGEIALSVDDKADNGNYRLYVYAKDSLGNGAIYKTSSVFATFLLSDEPPVGSAGLIKVEDEGGGEYEAILKLEVDVPSQVGYFYSVSSNGGTNWSTWRPYTNYVGVPVDTDDADVLADRIKVKFKGYYGTNISEIYSPSLNLQETPAYALASLEKIEPVRGGEKRSAGGQNDGLDIVFDQTAGKTIEPTEANPEMPETIAAGERYRIYQNGSYSFAVKDGSKEAVVFIVVSNFDDTEPVVQVKYSTIAPTNGSVVASLKSSEPIRITNLDTSSKTFKENGEFTFEYEDAVGFTGTATAVVSNIDTMPPEADIALHYNDNELKALISSEFGMIVVDSLGNGYDSQGNSVNYGVLPTTDNVLATSRIVAEIKPKEGGELDYQVSANSAGGLDSTIVMTGGKQASFTIMDRAGNTTVVKTPVLQALVTSLPKLKKTTLTRVDGNGNEVSAENLATIDGKTYSKGKIRVSFELEASSIPENTITIGSEPVSSFRRDYADNQKATLVLTDRLGNRLSQSFVIEGLDNEAPTLKLNQSSVSVALNKADFDFATDLGGYAVTDNVSATEDIAVRIVEQVLVGGQYEDRPLDLSKAGKHLVKYIARDQVGNESTATQIVYARSTDGMFVTANGQPLSEVESETAIVSSATVTFNVLNYNVIKTNGGTGKAINEAGTFDLLYYSGLVREGQMKYIATKLTYKQLVEGNFTVTFPKAGWYTIIVRNQERERIYATLLVSKVY
ncbi:hypothetical protein [Cohnella fermenti]|uniref:Ig-like domain-containing protein n=1 Tax=Cohnella fermenti TaxID=2565925 RepID=A0A4S4C618_9BACL|nr:hypothetical protein [Cohnella fermenti]THF83313.1 hypothetical protein E6C55_05535 [Cohnella fermenti]